MFYKYVKDGYILAIGRGNCSIPISENEYNEIMSAIINRPVSPKGKGYKLRTDLTWEEYDLPPEVENDDH